MEFLNLFIGDKTTGIQTFERVYTFLNQFIQKIAVFTMWSIHFWIEKTNKKNFMSKSGIQRSLYSLKFWEMSFNDNVFDCMRQYVKSCSQAAVLSESTKPHTHAD